MQRFLLALWLTLGWLGAAHAQSQCASPVNDGWVMTFQGPIGYLPCVPPYTNTPIRWGKGTVTLNPGLVSLGTKAVEGTVTVLSGVAPIVGDAVIVGASSGAALAVGLGIAGASIANAGKATVTFVTPIALGISLGSTTFTVTWFGIP